MSKFEILSDAEHLRIRFGMYGGSKDVQSEEHYVSPEFKKLDVAAGLLKLINEILDNSLDEYVRTGGEFANKIEVSIVDNKRIVVRDNGRGIPIDLVSAPDGSKMYRPVAAWGSARAGSNFDDSVRESIGANGIGSHMVLVISEQFIGETHDGSQKLILTANNGKVVDVDVGKSTKQFTQVTFVPDYKFFGLTELTPDHITMIEERIKSLSIGYQDIKFFLNGTRVSTKIKDYFPVTKEFQEGNVWLGFGQSNGSFQTFSVINGLSVKAGSHIDYVMSKVTYELSTLLEKKKKVKISPSKLKSYIKLFVVGNNFKALKFDSQTKERITNSAAEVKDFLGEIDWSKIAIQLFKDQALIGDILAYTKFQEDLEAKKALKGLESKKKIKMSQNFTPSVGEMKRLYLLEGQSAMGGLLPALGRKGNAFFALRGVPMNVWEVSHQKMSGNKEFSELYSLVTNNPDTEIVIATDSDADGFHIRGLLYAFFYRYFPEHISKNMLKYINTPIAAVVDSKGIPSGWTYTFSGISSLKGKVQYKKGLGSWNDKELKHIVAKDGIENMTQTFSPCDKEMLDAWFSGIKANERKEMILNAPAFNINDL